MTDGCLQPDTIDAFLSGRFDAAGIERVESHLETCDACRALVSQLARDSIYDAPAAATRRERLASSETLVDRGSRSRPAGKRLRPDRIDRYVVDRKLGEGGMGVVFLADDPELKRKVVIKLLHPDMLEPGLDGRARLLREAQAMAKVSHPNVVPIYDVGVHDDQVFLAMEFVDGMDLARWLETPRSKREIIAVFADAGRGLAAAHRAELVHRDFKPHNVMVGTHGDVKVTDFGLAQARLAPPVAGQRLVREAPRLVARTGDIGAVTLLESPITHTGAVVGTPAYMAPEQILAEFVDARSDQFGFCVALYEALYGVRPFVGSTVAELFESTLRGEVQVADSRGIPKRVRDAIRRGLAVEPGDRFPSMEALLAMLAPPARRTWLVALAVVGLAILGLGTALLLRHDRPAVACTGDAAELAAVWNPTRRHQLEAAFVATRSPMARPAFAMIADGVDRYATSWRSGHREACAATRIVGDQTEAVMSLRMRCLQRRRAELDALLDKLATPDDAIMTTAGEQVSRLPSPIACRNVEALADAKLLDDPRLRPELDAIEAELARVVADLADVHDAAASARLVALLPRVERVGYKPLAAEVHLYLAQIAENRQAWAEVEKQVQDAIEIAERAGDDRTRATAYLQLVDAKTSTMKLDEADRRARDARATIARLGNDPALLADLDGKIAALQAARHDPAGAETSLKSQIARLIGVYGATSHQVAAARQALGVHYNATRDHQRAYEQFELARDTYRAAVGPASPTVASMIMQMALQRFSQGRSDEALKLGEQGLAMLRGYYGDDHPMVAMAEQQFAFELHGAGRDDEAIALMKRVVERTAKVFGEHHVFLATSLAALATLQFDVRHYDEAYSLYDRALAIFVAAEGDDHADVVTMLGNLGVVRQRQGRLDEAMPLLERARAILAKGTGSRSPQMADALTRIGSVEVDRRHAEVAQQVLEQALAIRLAANADPGSVGWTERELARAVWDAGHDRKRAVAVARDAEAATIASGDREQLEKIHAWQASHAIVNP